MNYFIIIPIFPFNEKEKSSKVYPMIANSKQLRRKVEKNSRKIKKSGSSRSVVLSLVCIILVGLGGIYNYQKRSDISERTNTSQADVYDDYEKAQLVRVVDGDTVIVKLSGDRIRIRMIGIDTPESVAEDEKRNNEYGVMASDHTKELLSNVEYLYLTFGPEREDQYGRTLAYVWLSEPTADQVNLISEPVDMLNYIILRDGYGYHVEYKPNVEYADFFTDTVDNAKKNSTGLWQYDEFAKLWDRRK